MLFWGYPDWLCIHAVVQTQMTWEAPRLVGCVSGYGMGHKQRIERKYTLRE